MSLDDVRVQWMRDRVLSALGLSDPAPFEELLNRGDGEEGDTVLRFLNQRAADEEGEVAGAALLLRTELRQEELEVEIVETEERTISEGDLQDEDPDRPRQEELTETASVGTAEGKRDRKSKASILEFLDVKSSPEQMSHLSAVSDLSELAQGLGGESREQIFKIIKQTVYNLYFHVAFHDISEEFVNDDIMFFLRDTRETVSEPNDVNEANEVLPELLECGILNGHTLLMLKNIFSQVFLPALLYNQHKAEEPAFPPDAEKLDAEDRHLTEAENFEKKKEQPVEFHSFQIIRNEFLMNMQKFLSHIQRTIQQIEGEIKLEMPTINLDAEVSELATNPEVVETLEHCGMTWLTLISTAVEEQLGKVPQGNGPLAEIDLWRERNATLSALTEQIKLPLVRKVLAILKEAESGLLENLQLVITDLSRHHVEAVDNVRFLSTLERHLKNLTHGTGFNIVMDTIPSMMNSLRMVWIISRHYNKDERMIPLMERIAWEITARVCKVVDLRTLFKEDRSTAKTKLLEAKGTLEIWKKSYFDTRAQIEASGREQRWEFDRKRLFEKTDYMASICQDLYDIVQVIEEFYNIFGPELKAVTGDPKRIDDVLGRVDGLISPMEVLTFDPFKIKCSSQWKVVMEDFKSEVLVIEKEAKNFIDESFKTLRSAEAAFDMLLNFKHIRSRDAINKQMMMKFNDILAQYCKEGVGPDDLLKSLPTL